MERDFAGIARPDELIAPLGRLRCHPRASERRRQQKQQGRMDFIRIIG
jgi:hypothetical protein